MGLTDPQNTTRVLIQGAQRGDRDAFERLFARYRERLKGLVEARRREPREPGFDVDDVIQETLLRAFQGIGTFEWVDEESFIRWLQGISRNVILQLQSRATRRRALALDRDLPARGLSASKALRRHERFERLEKAIETLSPDHRQVILLARIEKVPIREIARRMDRSPDAVRHLLLRAVEKLRETFPKTESLHLPDRSLGKWKDDSHAS